MGHVPRLVLLGDDLSKKVSVRRFVGHVPRLELLGAHLSKKVSV